MVETALLTWTLNHILQLLVIMTRVGPVIFLAPVIGNTSIPPQIKILFTLAVSLILLPVVPVSADMMPSTALGYAIFVGSEVIFGATLAIMARFIFDAIDIAGQMVSISMGMGMAGAIDPENGTQVSLIGSLWNIITILVFLAINGHHIFFKTLADSFQWLQPGSINITQASMEGIMRGASHMFVLAIKIMAPAAAALFFSHVAMGIIAKTVPQVPIMIVAMPMNIAIGMVFVILSLGYMLPLLAKHFNMVGDALTLLTKGLGV